MNSVAIVDDSTFSVELIQHQLSQFQDQLQIDLICTQADEAALKLSKSNVDLVFLDIEMPILNGFQILEKIGEYRFKVVFTTSNPNYAIQAFKINAFNYLLKPIETEELRKVIQLFRERHLTNHNADREAEIDPKTYAGVNHSILKAVDNLQIETHGKTYFLSISKINFIEADRAYSKISYEGKLILVSKSSNQFEEILAASHFFRIHRSFIINPAAVKEIVKSENSSLSVVMNGGQTLPVARKIKDTFLKKMHSLNFH